MNQTGKNRRLLLILLSVVLSFSTLFGTVATNAYAESPVVLHMKDSFPYAIFNFHFYDPIADEYIDVPITTDARGRGNSGQTTLHDGCELQYVEVFYPDNVLYETISPADIGHRSDKDKHLQADGSMSASGVFEHNNGNVNFWYDHTPPNRQDPASLTVHIFGHKYAVNADLTDELFQFIGVNVEDDDDFFMGTNDADGVIDFDPLTFEYSANITYPITLVYEISELPLASNPGWTQDPTVYTVSITITNDGSTYEPMLHAFVTIVAPEDAYDIEFTNTWPPEPDPDPASVIIHATKEVRGTTLVAEMFEFLLADEEVDFYLTSTNDADGNIEFGPIEFDEEGEYIFYILELNEDGNNWTIDKSVFEVKVTVTIDREDDSKLVADVEYPEGGVVFVNTYKVPDETPKTGDIALLLLLGAGLMALGGTSALVQRKRSAQQ